MVGKLNGGCEDIGFCHRSDLKLCVYHGKMFLQILYGLLLHRYHAAALEHLIVSGCGAIAHLLPRILQGKIGRVKPKTRGIPLPLQLTARINR